MCKLQHDGKLCLLSSMVYRCHGGVQYGVQTVETVSADPVFALHPHWTPPPPLLPPDVSDSGCPVSPRVECVGVP